MHKLIEYLQQGEIREKHEAAAALATKEQLPEIEAALEDALHSIINNTIRGCGVPLSGSQSELTFDIARRLASSVMTFTARLMAREVQKDEVHKSDLRRELREAEANVARLMRELGES